MSNDEAIKSAVSILADAMIELIYVDPHSWSMRPCPTCKAIGAIFGKPFGCYLFQQRKKAQP